METLIAIVVDHLPRTAQPKGIHKYVTYLILPILRTGNCGVSECYAGVENKWTYKMPTIYLFSGNVI